MSAQARPDPTRIDRSDKPCRVYTEVTRVPAGDLEIELARLRCSGFTGAVTINYSNGTPSGFAEFKRNIKHLPVTGKQE